MQEAELAQRCQRFVRDVVGGEGERVELIAAHLRPPRASLCSAEEGARGRVRACQEPARRRASDYTGDTTQRPNRRASARKVRKISCTTEAGSGRYCPLLSWVLPDYKIQLLLKLPH